MRVEQVLFLGKVGGNTGFLNHFVGAFPFFSIADNADMHIDDDRDFLKVKGVFQVQGNLVAQVDKMMKFKVVGCNGQNVVLQFIECGLWQ